MNTDDVTREIFENTVSYLNRTRHRPISTYRLQLNHLFKFRDATNLLPYLHELGITDCYSSPYLKSRSGSLHGYDITDHNALNPDIGSPKDYEQFAEHLAKYDMGHILDFVPNHMGIFENPWWQDIMENGPSSPYSRFFDIDWAPIKAALNQKVLLPILEDFYGKVLESGYIHVVFEKGVFLVAYRNHLFPTDPKTSTTVLVPCLNKLKDTIGEDSSDYMELQSIITACNNLPNREDKETGNYELRKREKEVIKRRLRDLYSKNSNVQKILQLKLEELNGKPGNSSTFDALHQFLEEQVYRLSFWRVAGEEINYRRFFDINELAALSMEDETVFEATHELILELITSGKVTGLRIDHVDGLFSPKDYLWHLQKQYFAEVGLMTAAHKFPKYQIDSTELKRELLKRFVTGQLEGLSDGTNFKPLFLIVEKILGDKELLRKNWPVEGTTGYDYSSVLNGIYINKKNATAMSNIYKWFTGKTDPFKDDVYNYKNLMMKTSMAAEVNLLAHHLDRVSEQSRLYRDLTLNNLRDAIREVIACFPVYRTYIDAYSDTVDETDTSVINIAIAEAKKRNPAINVAVFDFIKSTLLLQYPSGVSQEGIEEQRLFVMRFQQFTGPVMAKGTEDTAFYIYNPLISLNEVGGNPQHFGHSIEEFHKHNIRRYKNTPYSLITTSTHDSKRSEDVRARINVLSEIPQLWRGALMRWSRLNRDKKVMLDDERAPDNNEEYYLYQTLLGTYPTGEMDSSTVAVYRERIQKHMLKSIREAKIHTSWISPNIVYEENMQRFISDILEPGPNNKFLADFTSFNQMVARCGIYNSLSQVVLKLLSPGVPDIYMGNEIWLYRLTDPDNRRPVNFPHRAKLLKQLKKQLSRLADQAELAQDLMNTKEDGRIKLYITWKSLNYRRNNATLFTEGSYIPLRATGSNRQHVCAFAWQRHKKKLIVVVPVLLAGLTINAEREPLGLNAWGNTYLILPGELSGRTYSNIFTGETINTARSVNTTVLPLARVLKIFPVAALELES